jgi:hypothetical protein
MTLGQNQHQCPQPISPPACTDYSKVHESAEFAATGPGNSGKGCGFVDIRQHDCRGELEFAGYGT